MGKLYKKINIGKSLLKKHVDSIKVLIVRKMERLQNYKTLKRQGRLGIIEFLWTSCFKLGAELFESFHITITIGKCLIDTILWTTILLFLVLQVSLRSPCFDDIS